MKKINIKSRQ